VKDIATLDPNIEGQFDLILALDVIHDLPNPQAALDTVYKCLLPNGTFLMQDIHASSHLEDNLSNPMASWLYSLSTLHCMTVSLAAGGVGLGNMWGEQLARSMLQKAGFQKIEYSPAKDLVNAIYICHKTAQSKL